MISKGNPQATHLSEFMRYLARLDGNGDGRLPALTEISKELDVSVASLREQLEVARALGLVEVRPRTGVRRLRYDFRPAVRQSLDYALAVNPNCFEQFADLRAHLEAAYWPQAVNLLTGDDKQKLSDLVVSARDRLQAFPVQIPHNEHRQLHLLIYARLSNPFVTGLLEAYWEAYEASGLDTYTDYSYLERVWQYHERMVNAIIQGDFTGGHRILIDHMGLLQERKRIPSRQKFE